MSWFGLDPSFPLSLVSNSISTPSFRFSVNFLPPGGFSLSPSPFFFSSRGLWNYHLVWIEAGFGTNPIIRGEEGRINSGVMTWYVLCMYYVCMIVYCSVWWYGEELEYDSQYESDELEGMQLMIDGWNRWRSKGTSRRTYLSTDTSMQADFNNRRIGREIFFYGCN